VTRISSPTLSSIRSSAQSPLSSTTPVASFNNSASVLLLCRCCCCSLLLLCRCCVAAVDILLAAVLETSTVGTLCATALLLSLLWWLRTPLLWLFGTLCDTAPILSLLWRFWTPLLCCYICFTAALNIAALFTLSTAIPRSVARTHALELFCSAANRWTDAHSRSYFAYCCSICSFNCNSTLIYCEVIFWSYLCSAAN